MSTPKMTSVMAIIRRVAAAYEIEPQCLLDKNRSKTVAEARQVAMWLCRRELGLSYPELGRCFGNRDHSTVMHSVRRVETQLIQGSARRIADELCQAEVRPGHRPKELLN
jgi:chromosomal replication initiator protein